MRPDDLAKAGSEDAQQAALFAYVAKAHLRGFAEADAWASGAELESRSPDLPPALPALKWFHAVPNGGARGDDAKAAMIRGNRFKATGVRAGVADTFLPLPRGGYAGLYIEMKKPTQRPKRGGMGGVSDEQAEFRDYVRSVGYGWVVCYDWREAVGMLQMYMMQ